MRPAVTVPPFSMLRFSPKRYSGVLVLPYVVPFWISICFKYAPAPLMIISPTPERVLQKLSIGAEVTCVESAASKRAKLPTGADIVVTNCICSALTAVNNSIQAEISVIFFIFSPCINGQNGLLYAFLYNRYIRLYPVLMFKILSKKKTQKTILKGKTEKKQQKTRGKEILRGGNIRYLT